MAQLLEFKTLCHGKGIGMYVQTDLYRNSMTSPRPWSTCQEKIKLDKNGRIFVQENTPANIGYMTEFKSMVKPRLDNESNGFWESHVYEIWKLVYDMDKWEST